MSNAIAAPQRPAALPIVLHLTADLLGVVQCSVRAPLDTPEMAAQLSSELHARVIPIINDLLIEVFGTQDTAAGSTRH